MLAPGTQVDRYEIIDHLGGGGFADVYKARHVHLGTLHALKILKPEHVASEQVRLRFLDEARVQAQLVHPNIARVTDIIAAEGVAGLVMEYLPGRSLAAFIEERAGSVTEEEILAIMLPVLDALHYAHERGVIHRDVKPDNIFLAVDDAGQQVPTVLDFGIAKVRGELRQEGMRKSTMATGMGTEGYAAPEQLKNAADVDRRADIFSLGITLFELATGRLPFERDSEVESLMALMKGDYETPDDFGKRSPTLVASVEKAIASEPRQRFETCFALGAALLTEVVFPVNPASAPVWDRYALALEHFSDWIWIEERPAPSQSTGGMRWWIVESWPELGGEESEHWVGPGSRIRAEERLVQLVGARRPAQWSRIIEQTSTKRALPAADVSADSSPSWPPAVPRLFLSVSALCFIPLGVLALSDDVATGLPAAFMTSIGVGLLATLVALFYVAARSAASATADLTVDREPEDPG